MKDKDEKEKLIEALRINPIVQIACQKVGIARATFYRWLKSDKKFKETVDEAKKEGSDVLNDLAESKLMVAIRDGNLKAIIYQLDHCHPNYSNKRLYLTDINQEAFTENIGSGRREMVYKLLLNDIFTGKISINNGKKLVSTIEKTQLSTYSMFDNIKELFEAFVQLDKEKGLT